MSEERDRIDFEKESTLDADIVPRSTARPTPVQGNVLLTGATGFLGSAILYELLEQTDHNVWCLVRGHDADSSLKKLRAAMNDRMLWRKGFEARIQIVAGDLSRPQLGLATADFEQLGKDIHAIYHAGARVNVLLPYSMLEPTNVRGTREILRLATTGRTKPVHHVSTAAILFPGTPNPGPVHEDTPLTEPPRHIFSYIHSKWISEKLLEEARSRSIPVAIYRPTIVGWHEDTGVFNPHDFLGALLRSCLTSQKAPDIDLILDIVALNHAAHALVHIARQPESLGRNYNLTAPRTVGWTAVIQLCKESGFDIEIIPYRSWFEDIQKNPRDPIHRIGPALPDPSDSSYVGLLSLLTPEFYPTLTRHNFHAMSQSLGMHRLAIDKQSLSVYLTRSVPCE